MSFSAHPLWLVGFRPFFSLACLSGLSLPVVWALTFGGIVAPPRGAFSPIQWHAHEMFFGFGWAALGGFLLTSTKNWVRVRGYHGSVLVFLAAAWLFERVGMWFGGAWPPALFALSSQLFLVSVITLLMWTLIRNRARDTYGDNIVFLAILPLFLPAKLLMLDAEHFQTGVGMAIGLFRMAFLVMLERTLTTFMKGAFQVALPRIVVLETTIKLLGLILVFASLLPALPAGGLALLLALLLGIRFALWKPQLAMRRLDIGVMYLGYLAIVGQLVIEFAGQVTPPTWIGSLSTHFFTFGAMGLIVPAMIVRIAKGHTGRKVIFDALDKWALRVMILAFVVRVVAPQLQPAGYLHWIAAAAICWFLGFSLLAWRYIPYLIRPRIDGKEH